MDIMCHEEFLSQISGRPTQRLDQFPQRRLCLVQKEDDNTAVLDQLDCEAVLSCRRREENQAGRDHFGTKTNIVNGTVTKREQRARPRWPMGQRQPRRPR